MARQECAEGDFRLGQSQGRTRTAVDSVTERQMPRAVAARIETTGIRIAGRVSVGRSGGNEHGDTGGSAKCLCRTPLAQSASAVTALLVSPVGPSRAGTRCAASNSRSRSPVIGTPPGDVRLLLLVVWAPAHTLMGKRPYWRWAHSAARGIS